MYFEKSVRLVLVQHCCGIKFILSDTKIEPLSFLFSFLHDLFTVLIPGIVDGLLGQSKPAQE